MDENNRIDDDYGEDSDSDKLSVCQNADAIAVDDENYDDDDVDESMIRRQCAPMIMMMMMMTMMMMTMDNLS